MCGRMFGCGSTQFKIKGLIDEYQKSNTYGNETSEQKEIFDLFSKYLEKHDTTIADIDSKKEYDKTITNIISEISIKTNIYENEMFLYSLSFPNEMNMDFITNQDMHAVLDLWGTLEIQNDDTYRLLITKAKEIAEYSLYMEYISATSRTILTRKDIITRLTRDELLDLKKWARDCF